MRGETTTRIGRARSARGEASRHHRARLRTLGALLLAAAAGAAQAAEVVRWVDEKGITHFGNPQFAPEQVEAAPVEIAPANGMVPAVAPAITRTGDGLRVVTLKLQGKRNQKGWREGNSSPYTGRRHRPTGYR